MTGHTAEEALAHPPTSDGTAPVAGGSLARQARWTGRLLRARLVRRLRGVRAWMLVLPVDVVMMTLPAAWAPDLWKALLATALVTMVMLTGGGRYRARLHLSVMDEIPGLLRTCLSAVAVVAIVVALRHEDGVLVSFLAEAMAGMALVVVGRIVTLGAINTSRRRRITLHRTILVGGGSIALELASTLAERPRYGLGLVGVVDGGDSFPLGDAIPYRGELADLGELVRRSGADVVLIADGDLDEKEVMEAIEGPACESCDVLIVPRMHYLRTQSAHGDHIGSIPVMRLGHANLDGPGILIKRAFDIVVSAFALLVASPVIGVCALLIWLTDRQGVIFRQTRVGRDGVIFDCLKLRSMRNAPVEQTGTSWSVDDDDRTTTIGRVMRATSLDELPQLWNVLRGDMSLVGPRPERPHFVELFLSQYDVYGRRHRVRAGLTGLAQVNGLRGDTSISERARYDNFYIENWSLWLDVKIMLQTVSEVLFARGR